MLDIISTSSLDPENKVCSELPDTKGKNQFLVNVMDLVSIRGRKKTAPDSVSTRYSIRNPLCSYWRPLLTQCSGLNVFFLQWEQKILGFIDVIIKQRNIFLTNWHFYSMQVESRLSGWFEKGQYFWYSCDTCLIPLELFLFKQFCCVYRWPWGILEPSCCKKRPKKSKPRNWVFE